MIRCLTIALALPLLASCAWLQSVHDDAPISIDGAQPYEKISFEGERATAGEREACLAAGGDVRRDGRRGWEQCIQPFADAGKACSDAADCMGECRLELSDQPNSSASVTGICQANDSPFGCYATVENGEAQPAICVD